MGHKKETIIKNRKPLTGRRIGKLVIMEEIPWNIPYSQNPKAKCRCDCGKEHFVSINSIQKQKVKSCGCARVGFGIPFVDKTGLKVGSWTYIEQDLSIDPGKGAYWKCVCECGVKKTVRGGSTLNPKGCKKCQVKKWKSYKRKTQHGYVVIRCPNHPRASAGHCVFEHILVMEKHIGRYVDRSESVHHINGIRDDNRIENLELWDKAHPAGQRNFEKMDFYMAELELKCSPADLEEFCKRILKL